MNQKDIIGTMDVAPHCAQINAVVEEIMSNHQSLNTDEILADIKLYSDKLPDKLRRYLYEFKIRETQFVLNIHMPINNYYIGTTPENIPTSDAKKVMSKIEILHALISSLLGEIFTWSSIQNGNLVNEIVPIKENIDKPISSGTSRFFDLHTEDGFHPLMGDYLSLFCLRNPNKANTVLSYIGRSDISDEIKAILFEKRFFVGTNIAHDIDYKPECMPILFGDWEQPYLRINLNNIKVNEQDHKARLALEQVSAVLRKNMIYCSLNSGNLLLIDNFRVVHGRDLYKANYDGNDRWLKRLYITNDLRKSRHLRNRPNSRVIIVK